MLISLLLLAAAPTTAQTDPLAPAREGKYMCVVPNKEKKTCVGTTSYKITGNSYESTTWLFLAPSPLLTMQVQTKGAVTGDQLCETMKLADFQAGTVHLNGQPADDATSGAVKSQIAGAIGPLDGKTICSEFKPAEDGQLLNQVTIDGTVRSDLSQKFIWVSQKDGYTLGM